MLVWINGLYEPGLWNDIDIFWNALLMELDNNERVETDKKSILGGITQTCQMP
jgi:hypothetical protein